MNRTLQIYNPDNNLNYHIKIQFKSKTSKVIQRYNNLDSQPIEVTFRSTKPKIKNKW